MADTLLTLANDPRTARLVRMLGLPAPVVLAREAGPYRDQALADATFALGTGAAGFAIESVRAALQGAGARVLDWTDGAFAPEPPRLSGAVFDGTGIRSPDDYGQLHAFFQPVLARLARNARLVILAAAPEQLEDPVAAAAARGLEGFTRSLAKEVGRRGTNANLFYLEAGAESRLDAALRFFAGPRCTFVDGQAVRLSCQLPVPADVPITRVLRDKVALVTGAARGIGAATAERLAEDGAQVVCVDMASDRNGLYETAARVGGLPFVGDVADPATPDRLADFLLQKCGGVDIVVHNAGITRDRTLAKMSRQTWDQVVAVNFRAIMAIDQVLLARAVLRDEGRVICLSSMGGIAGNFGQTNYAATKAALIGYVSAQARQLARRGITVNAAAPGFIETRMTAAMPLFPRELGRRLCSLSQGGQPRDVAELICFFASPGAFGITGNTLRVCGQSLLGA